MEHGWWLFMGYVAIINLAAFLTYGIDKRKAMRGAYRIPERVLIFLAVLGGSIGAWLGMYVFRHKTRKIKFYLGIPMILLLQIGILCFMTRIF